MDVRNVLKQRKETSRSKLRISRESFRKKILDRINEGEEIYNRIIKTTVQFEQAEQDFTDWDEFNIQLLQNSFISEYNDYKQKYETANTFYNLISISQLNELQEFKEEVLRKVNNLEQLVSQIEYMDSEVSDLENEPVSNLKSADENPESNNYVFVIHGNNEDEQIEVLMTLEKLGLIPVVLSELSSSGFELNNMLERYDNIRFAIVLLSGEDISKKEGSNQFTRRADQCTILELGYFVGKLGSGNVFPIYSKGLELPDDPFGLFYIEMDNSAFWKFRLAKELKSAGYQIDANNII